MAGRFSPRVFCFCFLFQVSIVRWTLLEVLYTTGGVEKNKSRDDHLFDLDRPIEKHGNFLQVIQNHQ